MFYERFAELCAENQKSQAFVVQSIGLNRAAIAKWKKGSIPNGDTVRKLAEFFGVSTDYLLGNVNEPFFYLDNKRILNDLLGNEEKPAAPKDGEPDVKEALTDMAKRAAQGALLMYDGEPLDAETQRAFEASLRVVIATLEGRRGK